MLHGFAKALEIRRGFDLVYYRIGRISRVADVVVPFNRKRIIRLLEAVQGQISCRLVKIRSGMSNFLGDDCPAETNVGLLDDVLDLVRRHDSRHHSRETAPHRQIQLLQLAHSNSPPCSPGYHGRAPCRCRRYCGGTGVLAGSKIRYDSVQCTRGSARKKTIFTMT